ncbi:hypothetical protein L7F22_039565 [Adiantum nelumboides]|nr:hypothetical protein [Adiantum nelumboides]
MRRQSGLPKRPSLLTRAVDYVFAFVRLAEFEILFLLFFVIVFLLFKDLTSRPEFNQILVKDKEQGGLLGASLFKYGTNKTLTRVRPFICCMPMRLDEGWNQIQFNLSDFTRRAYGTNYVETLRVQVHANCRIRRIYFSDRLYSEEEVPPEFKLFLPIQETRAIEAAYTQEPPPAPVSAIGA